MFGFGVLALGAAFDAFNWVRFVDRWGKRGFSEASFCPFLVNFLH